MLKYTVTEKRKPTYLLKEVKKLIKGEKTVDPPLTVKESTNNMGLTIFEAYQEILQLEYKDLYKSVTETYNYKVWQDVYKKKIKETPAYIKFKIVSGEFLLLSFKPDENQ